MSEALTLLEIAETPHAPEPAWLTARREAARASLRDVGLPGKRTEAYRFTSVKSLVESRFLVAHATSKIPESVSATVPASPSRIVLVDGAAVLDGFSVPGVRASSLTASLAVRPELEQWLGATTKDEHFVALNTASFSGGLLLEIEDGASVPVIEIVHVGTRSAQSVQARMLVRVGPRASVTLVETVLGGPEIGCFTNLVSEISVGEDASLVHVLVHEDEGQHIARHAVTLARGSRYHATSAALEGKLARIDQHVVFTGDGAEASLDGIFVATGEDHIDHHTRVEHRAQRCTSHQRYRGLADDEATAVFDGIVVVAAGASKTEAHQQSRNLLLSDKATIHTKPHLEIDTDDVICSHGATVGSLDEEQVFYMRARGIDVTTGRAMLTFAFLRELVERVPHEPTRDRLVEMLFRRLPGGNAIRDFV